MITSTTMSDSSSTMVLHLFTTEVMSMSQIAEPSNHEVPKASTGSKYPGIEKLAYNTLMRSSAAAARSYSVKSLKSPESTSTKPIVKLLAPSGSPEANSVYKNFFKGAEL